jgi:hypothetical protein
MTQNHPGTVSTPIQSAAAAVRWVAGRRWRRDSRPHPPGDGLEGGEVGGGTGGGRSAGDHLRGTGVRFRQGRPQFLRKIGDGGGQGRWQGHVLGVYRSDCLRRILGVAGDVFLLRLAEVAGILSGLLLRKRGSAVAGAAGTVDRPSVVSGSETTSSLSPSMDRAILTCHGGRRTALSRVIAIIVPREASPSRVLPVRTLWRRWSPCRARCRTRPFRPQRRRPKLPPQPSVASRRRLCA